VAADGEKGDLLNMKGNINSSQGLLKNTEDSQGDSKKRGPGAIYIGNIFKTPRRGENNHQKLSLSGTKNGPTS